MGQASESGVSLISVEYEATPLCACFSSLSLAQSETQATYSHNKLIGSKIAVNRLSGTRVINI